MVPKVATEDGDEQSTKKETGALKTCATLGLFFFGDRAKHVFH